ncbi:hypothetical protein GGQ88_001391 [Novosphingobium hassiacum]|uniref:Uncharacterized protein n=1 Tax=Novosphingobium hassiacum TaxID=173676 RepID=A0A7W5ZYP8_9SPHN|nr:hypothetical protein [Novosphingobium hassiacum]MBB3860130.1 hypothetical protein [Novosphingobium hassiacum]
MMKIASKIAAGLAAGSLLLAGAAADAKPRLTPEQQLAKSLEGRVAGKPANCIYTPRVMNTRIYDKTAIAYDAGNTIWVNRPDAGASSLDDSDIMVTQPFGSQLCSVDIVRMIDRTSGFWRGSVGLGQFVPYTKVKVAKVD